MCDENLICNRCNIEFNPSDASERFLDETLKEWNNLRDKLCADCAIDAIESMEDGIYFEYCENCGKEFDYTEKYTFENNHTSDVGIEDFTDKILCLDCLEDEYSTWEDSQSNPHF